MRNNNKDKQENWLTFQHKASRAKKGHYQAIKPTKESIFKTPDTIEGKVGVVRSGMGMSTEYHKRKHQEYNGDIATPKDESYRESKRRRHE